MQCSNCKSYRVREMRFYIASRMFLATVGASVLTVFVEPEPGFYSTLIFLAGSMLSAIILALYDGGKICKSCGKTFKK